MTSHGSPKILDFVEEVDVPVVIVRAKGPAGDEVDFSASPTWPGLVERFSCGVEHHWPDCSHFIPMQRPDAVVELLEATIQRWEFSRRS